MGRISENANFCRIRDAADPRGGISCSFYNGDDESSIEVDYACGPSSPAKVHAGAVTTYHATMTDPAGCGSSGPPVRTVLECVGGAALLGFAFAMMCCYRRDGLNRQRKLPTAEGEGEGQGAGLLGEGGGKPKPRPGCFAGFLDGLGFGGRAQYGDASAYVAGGAGAGGDYGPPTESHCHSLYGQHQSSSAVPSLHGGSCSGSFRPATARSLGNFVDDGSMGGKQIPHIAGLDHLMAECGMPDRTAAAAAWFQAQGWDTVSKLRRTETRAIDSFIEALRLKKEGPRARKVKQELQKDEWSWDAHSQASANARREGKRRARSP